MWKDYIDMVSKGLAGKSVEIEVITDDFGCQRGCAPRRFFGMAFNPQDNSMEVACEDLDHHIQNPVAIYFETEGPCIKSCGIVAQDGSRQILQFSSPLMLEA